MARRSPTPTRDPEALMREISRLEAALRAEQQVRGELAAALATQRAETERFRASMLQIRQQRDEIERLGLGWRERATRAERALAELMRAGGER